MTVLSSSPSKRPAGNRGGLGPRVRNRRLKGNEPKKPPPPHPLRPLGLCTAPSIHMSRSPGGVPLLLRFLPVNDRRLSDAPTLSSDHFSQQCVTPCPYWPTPIEPGKGPVNPPSLPPPHLPIAHDEPTSPSAYLLRCIGDSLIAVVTPQMGTRQWALIYDPNGHPFGFSDSPARIASLPFLPRGICDVVAFWGTYTPLKRLVGVTTHMVFKQLCGSHELVASRTVDTQCYPASTDGDTMGIPQALFTWASLTFETGTRHSLAVLIFILHQGSIGWALRRLAPGTPPKRVLQSIHVIRQRTISHTWNFYASPHSLHATPAASNSSLIMKIFTLNVQHTVTSKLAPLRHCIEFHEFPELLRLLEIGTTSSTFRFHSLYEAFFYVSVRKSPGVAVLIRRVASFSYVKSETRSDGHGVAVWFSMHNTSFLTIVLHLHASGQYEDCEALLSWPHALIISSPGTWCVLF